MKHAASPRSRKMLWIPAALAAILLFGSLALFSRTVLSSSNTSDDLHQAALAGKEPDPVEPSRPIGEPSAGTESALTQSLPLSLDAFEHEHNVPAYGDADALRQGTLCANDMMERNGQLYFFSSVIGEDGSERTELSCYDAEDCTTISLLAPNETVHLRDLQEQNGMLYVIAENDAGQQALLALPCGGGTPIMLYFGDFLEYRVYGLMVFLLTQDALLALPTNGGGAAVCLWKNTAEIELRSYCPSEAGVIVQLGPADWQEKYQCLYLFPPEGGHILLFEGTETISDLTAMNETVYFIYGESVQNTAEPQLVAIPLTDGSAATIPLPRPDAEPAAYLSAFFSSADRLVFCYRQWDHHILEIYVTASDGSRVLEKYLYENPHGERSIDTMTAKAMLGEDFLYLQGKSFFTGIRTTTCIPRTASSDTSQECAIMDAAD